MHHPQDDCTIFSEYASAHSNVSFVVEPDSCICSACFMDFNRFFFFLPYLGFSFSCSNLSICKKTLHIFTEVFK